jgi:hypothetical protein
LVSPLTRFVAEETKATKRPSPLMRGTACDTLQLQPFASVPSLATETRSVVCATRSCTNTSVIPLASLGTRFEAWEQNATNRPSLDSAGKKLLSFPGVPSLATLTHMSCALAGWGGQTASDASTSRRRIVNWP